jgi:hypothetical protein
MGGEELLGVGPFLLCLWKKNVDGSFSLVIVCWSFKRGVVGKKMYFFCSNTKRCIPSMTMALCTFFYFPLFPFANSYS